MARLTLKLDIKASGAPPLLAFGSGRLTVDQAEAGVFAAVVEVGTSEEDLAIAEIATPGYAVFQNLDDTNFVQVGKNEDPGVSDTMHPFLKLLPGEVAVLPIDPDITIRAKADTAAVNLYVVVYER